MSGPKSSHPFSVESLLGLRDETRKSGQYKEEHHVESTSSIQQDEFNRGVSIEEKKGKVP